MVSNSLLLYALKYIKKITPVNVFAENTKVSQSYLGYRVVPAMVVILC